MVIGRQCLHVGYWLEIGGEDKKFSLFSMKKTEILELRIKNRILLVINRSKWLRGVNLCFAFAIFNFVFASFFGL